MTNVLHFFLSRGWKGISTIIIIISGLLIMQLLATTQKVSNHKSTAKASRKVDVIVPEYKDFQLQISGSGTIRSVNRLSLSSAVNGQVVYSRNDLKAGTAVRKGDILIEIDRREAENTVYLSRANLINAIVSLIPDFVNGEDKPCYDKWNRYLSTLDIRTETPPLPSVTSQREKIKVSLRNIYSMYYNVKNAELQLAYHTLAAPFDGYVVSDGIREGSIVNPGQILAEISDAVNLEVAVPLPLSDFNELDIQTGNPAVILAPGQSALHLDGKIARYNTTLDRSSQTVSVHVALNNKDLNPAFFPGNFVDVRIPGRILKNVCRLPRHLLNQDNRIFVADSFRLGSLPVQVTASQDDYIFTSTPIPGRLRVVTTQLQKPLIGMDIRFTDPLGILMPDADAADDSSEEL